MTILITGVTGFVGRNLFVNLEENNLDTKVILRSGKLGFKKFCTVDTFNYETDFSIALIEVNVVIHCAARVHIMNDNSEDSLAGFKEINTDGTLNLARQAAEFGVKRFIFISSVNVSGESTLADCKITSDDESSPQDPYSISKHQAEIGLKKIAEETGMEVVIIRPPLVYGANAPGNFHKLAVLAKMNFPLPLASITNKRSLVGIDNLVDLIATCIEHPKAANQTFLASDDYDVSISYLMKTMISAMGKTPFLLPVPIGVLKFCAGLLGKKSVVDRISSNFQVDITHTKNTLDWEPPVSFEEGIRRCFN